MPAVWPDTTGARNREHMQDALGPLADNRIGYAILIFCPGAKIAKIAKIRPRRLFVIFDIFDIFADIWIDYLVCRGDDGGLEETSQPFTRHGSLPTTLGLLRSRREACPYRR